jgi:hypothetical protein
LRFVQLSHESAKNSKRLTDANLDAKFGPGHQRNITMEERRGSASWNGGATV